MAPVGSRLGSPQPAISYSDLGRDSATSKASCHVYSGALDMAVVCAGAQLACYLPGEPEGAAGWK
jgi:hypothetical protein